MPALPRPALPRPILALVAGGTVASGQSLPEAVDAAVRGGVNVVQLREKQMAAGELLVLARHLRQICGSRALLFVNDRLDVALACEADGVQLGERSLPIAAARMVADHRLLIGRSVHSVEGAIAAKDADLLVLGTIYATASHPGEPASGLGLIQDTVQATSLPVVAIGGITSANAADVMAAGAAGVAVVGAILGAKDPCQAAADMRVAMARR